MKLLDGKRIAEDMLASLREKIDRERLSPCLAAVLIGSDPASRIYIDLKERAAKRAGIVFRKILLPSDISQESLSQVIEKLNCDVSVHGILIQLPLPEHLDTKSIITIIDPRKDVDGFHPENIRLFLEKKERFVPVFPRAIFEILKASGVSLSGKKAIVIGNSDTFGDMMLTLLARAGISGMWIFGSNLKGNAHSVAAADIVITACGTPGLLSRVQLQHGQIVIDGGIAVENGKVKGDVDAIHLGELRGFLSPVPGGVGPVTIACLLDNVASAVRNR